MSAQVCYVLFYCIPLHRHFNKMTFKTMIEHKLFPKIFQALKIKQKKSRTFKDLWKLCITQ